MKPVIMTIIRRVLVIVGTWLSSKGIITEGDWQMLVVGNIDVLAGAAMIVGSVVWSIIKNRKLEKAK
jgi:hypothetical protein